MANTYSANVIKVDTSASLDYAKEICGIKYIAGSVGSSVEIKAGASSVGDSLWLASTQSASIFDHVRIRDPKGVYVTITGTSSAYLYLK